MQLLLFLKKKRRRLHKSGADRAFDIMNFLLIGIFLTIIIFPLLNLFSLAFSNGVYNPSVTFMPKGLTLQAFKYVLSESEFVKSILNSVIITVSVTIGSNFLMALAAYPLSKRDCPFRKFFMIFFIITMLFSAGIVPSYMLMKAFGLINSIWSVILVSMLNVFNMLLFKTFFEGIPEEIEEAARIDGAGGINLFVKIVIPMSLPVIASCCFFTLVSSWNNYGTALIYIVNNTQAYPLALYIYKLVQSTDQNKDSWVITNTLNIQSAAIVISIIPIVLVYPYVIRYIRGGLTVGSVKG